MSQQLYQGPIQQFLGKMVQSGNFKIKKAYLAMMPQLPNVPWNKYYLTQASASKVQVHSLACSTTKVSNSSVASKNRNSSTNEMHFL